MGILCESGGTILSENNSGSGNVNALFGYNGGTIVKISGTQPSGTTNEGVSGGGVIR